ncbi:MAG TPA: hypothetical protein VGL25_05955 [Casimicrobiaceae bacterium]|jgi:hypothetical protein
MNRSSEWFGAQALNSVRHGMASRHAVDIAAMRSSLIAVQSTSWCGIETAIAKVPLARGYRFDLLERREIPALAAAVKAWFPEISVGGASCYLREDFFRDDVYFADKPENDVLVVLIKKGGKPAGLFSCQRDRNALSLYARLGVIAPEHRGKRLSHAFPLLAEAIGRAIGMGMIYGMATLKVPHVQRAFETLGWQLIGITPGYDREMIAPGVVKRVYEAVYAKVLVAETHLLRPRARNLTGRTRAFFRLLFPRSGLQQT